MGSFSAFPIFNMLVSRKQLIVEQNGVKFEPWVSIQCTQGTFDS